MFVASGLSRAVFAVSPSSRYQDAQDFASDLRACLTDLADESSAVPVSAEANLYDRIVPTTARLTAQTQNTLPQNQGDADQTVRLTSAPPPLDVGTLRGVEIVDPKPRCIKIPPQPTSRSNAPNAGAAALPKRRRPLL